VCRSGPIRGIAIAIAFAFLVCCGGAVASVDESSPTKSNDAPPSGEGSGATSRSSDDAPPPPPKDAAVDVQTDAGLCLTLDPAQYDNSCQVDDDCVAAGGGTFCDGKPWCMCPGATISASEKTRFDEALKQITSTVHESGMGCMCPYFGKATCVAGACTLCGGAAGWHPGCPDGG
jgi:hypothetical protein